MPRTGRSVLAVWVACLALCAALASPAAAAPPKLRGMLTGIVSSNVGPPGISVLIDRERRPGERRTDFFYAGFADVASGRVPERNEHVRIASVSKGFSAYLAVLLAREGSLSLSDTLGSSIPGVLPNAEGVTLRQLLQHTSGLPEYIQAPEFGEQLNADPAAYLAPRQLTDFVRDDPLEFAPGSDYHYSDTDNIAAGLMEEEAAGRSYPSLLRGEIFGPLRMGGSSLPRTVAMPRPFMHGYDVEPEKRPEDVSELINPAGAWASGGIVSTPADLARFVPVYVPTILRASRRLNGAFRPGTSSPPGPGRNSAGLGIFRYDTRCGDVYGHTGSFPGYRLFVAGDAAGQRSVVFVVNAQIVPGQGSQQVAGAIRRAQTQAVCRALR
ncbi:MAG TPA: serine hydrolase domain-containing protein [Solirubrobacterales bacterium]|nr:serine hydrolase domain-containing protein [Solirubrobacterales bacterium]